MAKNSGIKPLIIRKGEPVWNESPRKIQLRLFHSVIKTIAAINIILIFATVYVIETAPQESAEMLSIMKTVLIASMGGFVGFLGGQVSKSKDE